MLTSFNEILGFYYENTYADRSAIIPLERPETSKATQFPKLCGLTCFASHKIHKITKKPPNHKI
ncbi:protein of unknown function [Ruminococcaceae bacterium BL-6]|nr:protein of unknown function [Ruminococcaceae bacterium BL-6]